MKKRYVARFKLPVGVYLPLDGRASGGIRHLGDGVFEGLAPLAEDEDGALDGLARAPSVLEGTFPCEAEPEMTYSLSIEEQEVPDEDRERRVFLGEWHYRGEPTTELDLVRRLGMDEAAYRARWDARMREELDGLQAVLDAQKEKGGPR